MVCDRPPAAFGGPPPHEGEIKRLQPSILPLREGEGRRRRQGVTHPEVPPEPSATAKPLVVKLLTDDPNIVIYWFIDNTGGAL